MAIPTPGQRLTAIRLEAIPDKSLPKGGVGRSHNDGNFVLTSIQVETKDLNGQNVPLKLNRAVADFAQQGYPVEHAVSSPNPKKNGWAVSPQLTQPHTAIFYFAEPVELAAARSLTVTLDHQFEFSYPGFSLGRFRLSFTGDDSPTLDGDLPDDLFAIIRKSADERTARASTLGRSLRHAGAADSAAARTHRPEGSRIEGDPTASPRPFCGNCQPRSNARPGSCAGQLPGAVGGGRASDAHIILVRCPRAHREIVSGSLSG